MRGTGTPLLVSAMRGVGTGRRFFTRDVHVHIKCMFNYNEFFTSRSINPIHVTSHFVVVVVVLSVCLQLVESLFAHCYQNTH